MQIPRSIDPNERACPVPDKVFAALHKSNPADAAQIAATLPEAQRAQLAGFCYKRKHLAHLSIMIASTCSRHSLVMAMGAAGGVLFNQSRDPEKAVAELQKSAGDAARKSVSLATFKRPEPEPEHEALEDDDTNVVQLR